MKKSLIMITTALILAMSVAGCGQKADNNTDKKTTPTQQTDASGAYENTGESNKTVDNPEDQNYSEAVDMKKVEGQEAISDTKESEYRGTVGDSKVTIEDAKIIEYDGEDVIVVSFEFTNKSSSDQSFTGMFDVAAIQNDEQLPPATVVGVEGIEMLSVAENISSGKTITVQKAYKLRDKTAPVTIDLVEFGAEEDTGSVNKTFSF